MPRAKVGDTRPGTGVGQRSGGRRGRAPGRTPDRPRPRPAGALEAAASRKWSRRNRAAGDQGPVDGTSPGRVAIRVAGLVHCRRRPPARPGHGRGKDRAAGLEVGVVPGGDHEDGRHPARVAVAEDGLDALLEVANRSSAWAGVHDGASTAAGFPSRRAARRPAPVAAPPGSTGRRAIARDPAGQPDRHAAGIVGIVGNGERPAVAHRELVVACVEDDRVGRPRDSASFWCICSRVRPRPGPRDGRSSPERAAGAARRRPCPPTASRGRAPPRRSIRPRRRSSRRRPSPGDEEPLATIARRGTRWTHARWRPAAASATRSAKQVANPASAQLGDGLCACGRAGVATQATPRGPSPPPGRPPPRAGDSPAPVVPDHRPAGGGGRGEWPARSGPRRPPATHRGDAVAITTAAIQRDPRSSPSVGSVSAAHARRRSLTIPAARPAPRPPGRLMPWG